LEENPSLYEIKNASLGARGYVHDGWKRAVQEATRLYSAQTGERPQRKREINKIIFIKCLLRQHLN